MTRARVTRVTRVALVAGAVVVTAGCAVGPEERPAAVPDEDVPFGLLDAERTPAPAPARASTAGARLYLADDTGRLVPVTRADAARTPDAVAASLREPLREAEVELGLGSPVAGLDPPVLRGVELVAGLLTVDLDETFTVLDADTQRLAIAQVVLSFTALPGIGQVTFTVDGRSVDVPLADGSLSSAPVARDDYADLVAR